MFPTTRIASLALSLVAAARLALAGDHATSTWSVNNDPAWSSLEPCARGCFTTSWGGCWNPILDYTMGCASGYCTGGTNECVCRGDKQSVATGILSSCIKKACTIGDQDIDISSAVAVYTGYCSGAGYAIVTGAQPAATAGSAQPGSGTKGGAAATPTAGGSSTTNNNGNNGGGGNTACGNGISNNSGSIICGSSSKSDAAGGMSTSDQQIRIALGVGLGLGLPAFTLGLLALCANIVHRREGIPRSQVLARWLCCRGRGSRPVAVGPVDAPYELGGNTVVKGTGSATASTRGPGGTKNGVDEGKSMAEPFHNRVEETPPVYHEAGGRNVPRREVYEADEGSAWGTGAWPGPLYGQTNGVAVPVHEAGGGAVYELGIDDHRRNNS